MEVFKNYAIYYDILYNTKDYKGESNYIHQLIQSNYPNAKTILSLGCGTGNYEFELASLGYEVWALDFSPEMIVRAEEKRSQTGNDKVHFKVADIRDFSLDRKFDVIISLFHVISYLVTNDDVLAALKCAHAHLNGNGIMIFDYWYGPRVLLDGPTARQKHFEDNSISVNRVAEPTLDLMNSKVDIIFSIDGVDKQRKLPFSFKEQHHIRFFFHTEIVDFAKRLNYSVVKALSWMSFTAEPGDNWYGINVFRKK